MQAAASVVFVAADAAAESDESCVDAGGAAAVGWPIVARVACADWNSNWPLLVEQESCSVVVGSWRRSHFLTSHPGNARPKQDSNCAESAPTFAARRRFSIE